MLGKDRLDDRQAETGTLFGALDGNRALAEGRQDDGDLFFRNAGAVVLDRDVLTAAGRPADLDMDLATLRREFDGIGEKVCLLYTSDAADE